jgi:hypothetical protein
MAHQQSNGMHELISNTEQYVKAALASRDASHDFNHIDRVRKLALVLGKQEGLDPASLAVVEVAALLHDIRDWKYASGELEQCSMHTAASWDVLWHTARLSVGGLCGHTGPALKDLSKLLIAAVAAAPLVRYGIGRWCTIMRGSRRVG